MPLITARESAISGALKGASALGAYTLVTELFSSSPQGDGELIGLLLKATLMSVVFGGFAGGAYGLILGHAKSPTFGAHVRAGIAAGVTLVLVAFAIGVWRASLSGRWFLLSIVVGVVCGAIFGALVYVGSFAERGKPAA